MMNSHLLALTRRYESALRKHLQAGAKPSAVAARRLGQQAVTLGLETLDLARIHRTALAALQLPGWSSPKRNRMENKAALFFNEAITPIEKTHCAGKEAALQLTRRNKALSRRTARLAATERHLKEGILERKTAEEALRKSGRLYSQLWMESRALQDQLQNLAHQILSAQEEDRKNLSRDLRDEIAQTLLGINARLLTLRKGAGGCTERLAKEIADTQRLVAQSIKTIKRFALKFSNAT